MKVALYLRLSVADGDLGKDKKEESNSIENQRLLLQNYLTARPELEGTVTEYVDDGYSGTNFERPAFRQMIEDAKRGKIQVILVKDLSRLGRDYIGVGDYLEQIFPILGIHFIAVNSNYDSDRYIGTTMGLDMSISNLVNHMYSRDVSQKVKSGKRACWKQGRITGGRPPLGYRKDPEHKGKWLIEPEEARYVRMIFEKAIAGWSNVMIATFMNDNGVPPPGKFGDRLSILKISEEEWVWTTKMVWMILNRYEYTGALVQGKRKTVNVCSKATRKAEDSEKVIIDGMVPPIVTKQEFLDAQSNQSKVTKKEFRISKNTPLKGKVRCGNCRLTLASIGDGANERLYCLHKRAAGKYSKCSDMMYPTPKLQVMVWEVLHRQLLILLQVADKMQAEKNKKQGKETSAKWEQSVSAWKAERIRQYEAYAEGTISIEQYLKKKEELTGKITALEQQIASQRQESDGFQRLSDGLDTYSEQAKLFVHTKSLTRDMVEAFIDTVYVYGEEQIEVVFKFEDVLGLTMEQLEVEEKAQ
jgi:DNA invertase Pin-like site-specific DNA recombinase